MERAKKAQESMNNITRKSVESAAVWADANQRVLEELVEFSAGSAKEGAGLYAELQQSAIDTLRENHLTMLRWQAAWPEALRNPLGWYQDVLSEGIAGAQRAVRFVEGNAQAITRSAERLQTSAEEAGKGIHETFTALAAKMKDVYAER